MEFSVNFIFGDIHKSNTPSWTSISIACQRYTTFKKFFYFLSAHSWLVICIHKPLNKHRSWSTYCNISLIFKSVLVNWKYLIAFIRIPSWAYHTCTQRVSITENNFSHYTSSWFDRRQISKLCSLDINVVSNKFSNCACVGRCSTSLAINSLMNWF